MIRLKQKHWPGAVVLHIAVEILYKLQKPQNTNWMTGCSSMLIRECSRRNRLCLVSAYLRTAKYSYTNRRKKDTCLNWASSQIWRHEFPEKQLFYYLFFGYGMGKLTTSFECQPASGRVWKLACLNIYRSCGIQAKTLFFETSQCELWTCASKVVLSVRSTPFAFARTSRTSQWNIRNFHKSD